MCSPTGSLDISTTTGRQRAQAGPSVCFALLSVDKSITCGQSGDTLRDRAICGLDVEGLRSRMAVSIHSLRIMKGQKGYRSSRRFPWATRSADSVTRRARVSSRLAVATQSR